MKFFGIFGFFRISLRHVVLLVIKYLYKFPLSLRCHCHSIYDVDNMTICIKMTTINYTLSTPAARLSVASGKQGCKKIFFDQCIPNIFKCLDKLTNYFWKTY